MEFPKLLKTLSYVLLIAMVVAGIAFGGGSLAYAAGGLIGGILVFINVYALAFALDKLDRIHHNSKEIGRVVLQYAKETKQPYGKDESSDESISSEIN